MNEGAAIAGSLFASVLLLIGFTIWNVFLPVVGLLWLVGYIK